MSRVESICEYIKTCPHINLLAEVTVDLADEAPTNYAVIPGGDTILTRYIDGGEKHQYSFSLVAREFTFQDVERVENAAFLEQFSEWIGEQERARNFPDFGEGIEITAMECANGFLYQLDETGQKGLYQIQCKIFYTRRT